MAGSKNAATGRWDQINRFMSGKGLFLYIWEFRDDFTSCTSLRLVIKVGCMCITNILWLDKSLCVRDERLMLKRGKITQFVATVAISILSFVLFSDPSDFCAGWCFLGRVLCLQVWSLCSWRCCLRLCIPVCCNPNDTSFSLISCKVPQERTATFM